MAIQFAPKSPGIGENLGGAIGEGLDRLIQRKIGEIQKNKSVAERRETYKKAKLPEWLADLSEKQQEIFLKEFDFLPPEEKENFANALSTLDNNEMMNHLQQQRMQQEGQAGQQQQQPQIQPVRNAQGLWQTPIFTPMGQEQRPEVQQPAEDFGNQESIIPGMNKLREAGQGFQRQPSQASSTQSFPERGRGTNGMPSPTESYSPSEQFGNLNDQEPIRNIERMQQPRMAQRQRPQREFVRKGAKSFEINRDIEEQKLLREAFKDTKEAREGLLSSYQVAKNVINDLNRMEELEKEGKLDTPGYAEFLERAGLDIPALMNPGSEEFNKLANNFLRDAKDYYGGRVTNFEATQFLKTVPSLSQSPEGRKRVIANLKNLNRAKIERYQAYRDILKKNNGKPPYDLAERVEDRLDDRLDYLAEQFRKDLNKPVPKGQDPYITGIQAGIGSILGAPGKLISGIGNLLSKGAA